MGKYDLFQGDVHLVEMATEHIERNFKPNQHHAASIIKTQTGLIYKALHLDIRGFDICGEAVALSAMMADDKCSEIDTVVTVLKQGMITKVINPCGNCRQMILQYSPNAFVIVENSGELSRIPIKDLLPYPY
ncbi:MAG: hypothetical protein U0X91_00515 [Spirosomataceae bacterium]